MATRSTVPRPTRTPRKPRPSEVRGPQAPSADLVLAAQIVQRLERLREHMFPDNEARRPEGEVSLRSVARDVAQLKAPSARGESVRPSGSLDSIIARTRTHNSRLVGILSRTREIKLRQLGSSPVDPAKPGSASATATGAPGQVYEAFDALDEQDRILDAIATDLDALEAV